MKEFEKHSLIIFFLTMTGSIINYLFQIFMGRMLDVASFGIINTVSSFYVIISIPATVILMFVSKYVSEYKAQNMQIGVLIKKTLILVIAFSITFSIVGIFLSDFVKSLIKIDNVQLLYIIILAAGFGFILYISLGGLQGEKNFIAFGIISMIMPFTKLFGSIIFLTLGLGLNGVISSFLIGNILAMIVGFLVLKIDLKAPIENISIKVKKNVLQFAWAALLINIGTNVLTNIDIIIIKRYFSEEVTGLYSAASVLGKIIIFAASTTIFVLFPYAAETKTNNENKNNIIIKSFLYGGFLSIICALGLNILSKYIVSILLGSKYLESVTYILPISIWAIVFCFVIILSNYLLAIDKAKLMSYSMVIGCIIIFLIISNFHNNIKEIIYILTIISFVILLIGIFSLFNKKQVIKNG
jgi:O-antigen/teichoic acid export membrane protein